MNFEELKTRIADSTARSDIECHCQRREIDGHWWYDTRDIDEESREFIDDAIAYLTVRRLIEHRGRRVRLLDAPAGEEAAAPVVTPVAEAFGAWVDIDRRLPEILHDVLVAWPAGEEQTVDIAYRNAAGEWVLTGSDPDQVIRPSHWMALPAGPEA